MCLHDYEEKFRRLNVSTARGRTHGFAGGGRWSRRLTFCLSLNPATTIRAFPIIGF